MESPTIIEEILHITSTHSRTAMPARNEGVIRKVLDVVPGVKSSL
jgi:hypothetical protein